MYLMAMILDAIIFNMFKTILLLSFQHPPCGHCLFLKKLKLKFFFFFGGQADLVSLTTLRFFFLSKGAIAPFIPIYKCFR